MSTINSKDRGRDDHSHDDKPWRSITTDRQGHTHVKFGTNRLDEVRTFLEDVARGYGLAGTLRVTVEDAGEGFMRLTFDWSKVRKRKAGEQFADDVRTAVTGKDWWTCREEGYDEATDTEWYVARYNGGPIL